MKKVTLATICSLTLLAGCNCDWFNKKEKDIAEEVEETMNNLETNMSFRHEESPSDTPHFGTPKPRS